MFSRLLLLSSNLLCVKKSTFPTCAWASILALSLVSCQSTNLLSRDLFLGVRALETCSMLIFYSVNAKPLKACRANEKAAHYNVCAFCLAAAAPRVQTRGQQMGPAHVSWVTCLCVRACYLCHHECATKLLLRKRFWVTTRGPRGYNSPSALTLPCVEKNGVAESTTDWRGHRV